MAIYNPTTATYKIIKLNKPIRAVAGGTSASKTISILFWLIDRAIAYPLVNKGATELISIVSESYPHLEKGAMLDFENIMKDRGYWDDDRWNKTKHVYTFESGSKIEFFSVDTYGKAHGPRRDILYINEANNLEYKIADQLITRTRKIVWLDWNPSEEFWFYTEMINNELLKADIDFITLTYLDNEALDQQSIDRIESHKNNRNWWRVYGLGLLGEIEGRIYTGWRQIEPVLDVHGEIESYVPHEARLETRGLDFGYSHDEACIVDIYKYNGGFIIDERLYQKGQSNERLAKFLLGLEEPESLVIADSAEPKSIDEIASYGVNIVPCVKGPGSKNRRINYVQDQRISYTSRSFNVRKEYQRYMWKTDKNGKILTIAEDGFDHAMDASGYGIEPLDRGKQTQEVYSSGNFASAW